MNTRPPRCELSELPADQCGCRKHRPDGGQVHVEPAAVRAPHTYTPAIEARYAGTCLCGDRYEVGDPIRAQRHSNGQGTGRWVHAECAGEV